MRAKRIFRDALIILVTSFGLLVGCEIVLRIIFPEKARPFRKQKYLAYKFNEDYLFSLKPNLKKRFTRSAVNGGDTIFWKTNEHAFRGNSLRADSQMRIIVYGDSNIQARFSRLENTFAYKLEQYLQADRNEKIEVINAGVIGFGPDQSLIRFAKEVDIYKPNLVLFHIFADNDFGDIIRNRLVELDKYGNLIETSHTKTIDPRLKTKFADVISASLVARAASKVFGLLIPEKTRTAEELIQKYILRAEEEYSVYKQSKPKAFSHLADHYDFDIALFPEAESAKTKIKLMSAVLNKAKAIANSKDVAFMVVIQPSAVDLTTNFKFSYEHLEKYPGYKRTNLTDAVENICIANNINRVNLLGLFRNNHSEDLFFKSDSNHWNDRGQDLAAKETAEYIAQKMLKNRQFSFNAS